MCIRDRDEEQTYEVVEPSLLYELGHGARIERRRKDIIKDVLIYAVEHGLVVRHESGSILADGTNPEVIESVKMGIMRDAWEELYNEMRRRGLIEFPPVSVTDVEKVVADPLNVTEPLEVIAQRATEHAEVRRRKRDESTLVSEDPADKVMQLTAADYQMLKELADS